MTIIDKKVTNWKIEGKTKKLPFPLYLQSHRKVKNLFLDLDSYEEDEALYRVMKFYLIALATSLFSA